MYLFDILAVYQAIAYQMSALVSFPFHSVPFLLFFFVAQVTARGCSTATETQAFFSIVFPKILES